MMVEAVDVVEHDVGEAGRVGERRRGRAQLATGIVSGPRRTGRSPRRKVWRWRRSRARRRGSRPRGVQLTERARQAVHTEPDEEEDSWPGGDIRPTR